MMSRRIGSAILVSSSLAAAIHTDWHFARPAHHRLSLGLSWHWLLAIPVFALIAWYVARVWSTQVVRASAAILASGIVVAGLVEPAWEYFVDDAPIEWAFGAARNGALAAYIGTGLLAYVVTLAVIRRPPASRDLETLARDGDLSTRSRLPDA